MGRDSYDNEAGLNPQDDNGDERYFADLPAVSHTDVRASRRRNFETICKLCGRAIVAVR